MKIHSWFQIARLHFVLTAIGLVFTSMSSGSLSGERSEFSVSRFLAEFPDGCTPKSTPGCSGCICETKVCAFDLFCCNGAWDGACVNQCKTFEPTYCPPAPTPNPTPSPSPTPSLTPTPSPNPPGCQNCACEAVVCKNDPYCCKVSWDATCATECKNFMPEYCKSAPPPIGCPASMN